MHPSDDSSPKKGFDVITYRTRSVVGYVDRQYPSAPKYSEGLSHDFIQKVLSPFLVS